MGRLSNISGKKAAVAFQKAGWVARGQAGSHLVLTKPGARATSLFRSIPSLLPELCVR